MNYAKRFGLKQQQQQSRSPFIHIVCIFKFISFAFQFPGQILEKCALHQAAGNTHTHRDIADNTHTHTPTLKHRSKLARQLIETEISPAYEIQLTNEK